MVGINLGVHRGKVAMANLTGGRELVYVTQRDTYAGSLFSRIIRSVNTLSKNIAVAPVGKLSPPPPIDSIQVKGVQTGNQIVCPGEILHFTLTHNVPIQKGVQYFSEWDTSQNFIQPHVIDHGASRTHTMTLPTLQDDGMTPNVFYLRSYAQYHGSNPSVKTVLGGLSNATQIVMSGTGAGATSMTPLPSTGSGTAAPNGQQGGKGIGVVLNRPPQGPKRFTL